MELKMPHNENCHHLLNSLSEYVDGQLGDELCLELEQHLAGCENCKIVIDTLKRTIYLYQVSKPETNIPTDVRERLFQKLDLSDYLDK